MSFCCNNPMKRSLLWCVVGVCASSWALGEPARSDTFSWNASGNGIAGEGIYTANKKPRGGFGDFEITPAQSLPAGFILSGNVRLPNNGALSIGLQKGEDAPFTISRNAQGTGLRMGRERDAGAALDEDLPLRIRVVGDFVEVTLGGLRASRRLGPEPLDLRLALRAEGTRLSDLELQPVAPGRYFPLLALPEKTNASLADFGIKPLPAGFSERDGVPFLIPAGRAVDVAASMRGAREPLRNKKGYFNEDALNTLGRVGFRVPGDQYSALHVLAFSAGRPDHAQRMTVRVGFYGKSAGILEDVVATVPGLEAAKGAKVISGIPVTLENGGRGTIHHLRIPMTKTGNVRGFHEFDLEFTRDMNTHVLPPDPNEFGKIAVGMPSDAVVLAATLEPSPVTMIPSTTEAGNIFHETQKAEFRLALTNRSGQPQTARAFAEVAGPGTGEEHGVERKKFTVEKTVSLAPGETKEVVLDVSPGRRGWFSSLLGVDVDGQRVQQRDTTFAVLAPDTRKALKDSPFGIWQFWSAHFVQPTPDQIERLASMMHKGGWRHTYGGVPSLDRGPETSETDAVYASLWEKYRINFTIRNLPKCYQRDRGWWDEKEFAEVVAPALKAAFARSDGYFKVLHESRSSSDLIRRFSPYFGGTPYDMPREEKAVLEEQWTNVKKYTAALKAADPRAKVVLINDYPAFVDQYLLRGFPAENFDAIGLEGAMFLRAPERQPDWLSLLGILRETRLSMKKHGYDKPIWTTEALYHPTEAGALSLHEQAVISVREAVMALQLGVERMAAAGTISDPSDDYHWTNWGSTGLCFRDPEFNPKPAYAAYAWLTQVLDQAKPDGKLKTPNHSLHFVRFLKPDGSPIYVAWTARGVQKVTLDVEPDAGLHAFDLYGNPIAISAGASIEASPSPLYITGAGLRGVASAEPLEITDTPTGVKLLDFDQPGQLRALTDANPILENSWETPNLRGNFEIRAVEMDGVSALRVQLKPDEDPRKLIPRYVELALEQPITLKGRPEEFVFRVKGNSGWVRVLFELKDAKGRVWTSLGNQYAGASNAADPHGESFVNFEGWHTMRFPIVGMYPGKDQEIFRPKNYNWWAWPAPEIALVPEQQKVADAAHTAAMEKYRADFAAYETARAEYEKDPSRLPKPPKAPREPKPKTISYTGAVPVDYPLTLTKLIIAMRPSILYLDEEVPVKDPVIFLDNLWVSPASGAAQEETHPRDATKAL